MTWPPANPSWYPKIRDNLAKVLEPLSSSCRGPPSCSAKTRSMLATLDEGFQYAEGATPGNYSDSFAGMGCTAYCFTKWRNRDGYTPPPSIANQEKFTDWKSLPLYGKKKNGKPMFIN